VKIISRRFRRFSQIIQELSEVWRLRRTSWIFTPNPLKGAFKKPFLAPLQGGWGVVTIAT
jgi:hypothetical protein